MKKTRMQESLANICDVFAGGDGAISYMNFRMMMESLEESSDTGNCNATQCCEMVYRFERLIKYSKEK